MTQPSQELSALVRDIPPITPDLTVDYVGELLLSVDEYQHLLSLPIIDEGRPIGVISRYELMKVFVSRFGRELQGAKPIGSLMNPQPLVVDMEMPMETAAQFITGNMSFPITEDFIITENGRYRGIGMVLDLLRIMEEKVTKRTHELAAAYKNLQQSQSQLIQSEKMASLGQMVAGVAHEINTPLGYVRSNIELLNTMFQETSGLVSRYEALIANLADHPASTDEHLIDAIQEIRTLREGLFDEDSIEQIETVFSDTLYGLDQISELVLNLKDFSRLDKAKVENVSINECMDSALLIGNNAIKYRAEVIKDYGDIPLIACSPSQINQVFLNILTNAAQAIEEKGSIHIRSYHDDGHVYISIRDSGKGISEEHLEKIFDPFFTTKPVGQGSGMGLSISYKIIEQHNGRITVSSALNQGTEFTIQLPTEQGAKEQLETIEYKEARYGTETHATAGG
jgi:two-component system NtrC family sensor kinase